MSRAALAVLVGLALLAAWRFVPSSSPPALETASPAVALHAHPSASRPAAAAGPVQELPTASARESVGLERAGVAVLAQSSPPSTTEVPAAAGTQELPLELRMATRPTLIVDVTTPGGGALPRELGLDVDLEDRQPFLGPDGSKAEAPWERSPSASSSQRFPERPFQRADPFVRRLRYGFLAGNRVRVPGLRPESALEVRVVDELGRTSQPRRVLPSQLDAREPVVLALHQAPVLLRVHVSDDRGAPVQGALVHGPGDRGREVLTDEQGGAELVALSGRAELWVRKEGLAPALLTVALDDPVSSVDVVLHRGSSLRVLAVDPQSKPVPIDSARISFEGEEIARSKELDEEPGIHVLDGLPDHTLAVTIRVARVEHTRLHAPGAGDLVFQVPAVGSLDCVIDSELEELLILGLRSEGDSGLGYRAALGQASRVSFGSVLPGSYELDVRCLYDGNLSLELLPGLQVVAGETTVVPLSFAKLRRQLDVLAASEKRSGCMVPPRSDR